ncbi:MAG TPA: oxidative damage protection protein [Thermoanaerobaculia bacterium]|nr:oxidative damage protection protein [Thermoanaerobaculia bacterium]
MSDVVSCARCGETKPRMDKPPQPGALGRELQEGVCADCWAEWQAMEVMVINELRLNFMDPASQQVLDEHMRKFFFLDGGEGGDAAMPVPDEKDR